MPEASPKPFPQGPGAMSAHVLALALLPLSSCQWLPSAGIYSVNKHLLSTLVKKLTQIWNSDWWPGLSEELMPNPEGHTGVNQA